MLNKNLVLVVLSVFAAGCGMEANTYVMTKERVGYNKIGNGGCIMGKCAPAPAPKETTRKIYVLELTKPVPESEVQKIEQKAVVAITETTPAPVVNAAPAPSAPAVVPASTQPPARVVPVIGDQPVPAVQNGGSVSAQMYTVQKDDTLQKISKKVYGTYGRWYKIYQANKDKIKNPNFVRPGTVLNIPEIK